MQLGRFLQSVHYRCNDISTLPIVLENTASVTIPTLCISKGTGFASLDIYRFYFMDNIFHLHAVSSYILNSARSHFARYIRQILGSPPTVRDRPSDEVVPHDTCSYFHKHLGIGLLRHSHALYGRMQQYAIVHFFYKKQIASPSYREKSMFPQ